MSKKEIDPAFLAAMEAIAANYWQQEVDECIHIFTMPKPDLSEFRYENKKLEAELNHIMKMDSAKAKKLSLLRQMALVMSNDLSPEEKSQAESIVELLAMAQERIK